jgi:hypothetical protein
MPDGAVAGVTAPGGWRLRADVPGGIFSLASAVEACLLEGAGGAEDVGGDGFTGVDEAGCGVGLQAERFPGQRRVRSSGMSSPILRILSSALGSWSAAACSTWRRWSSVIALGTSSRRHTGGAAQAHSQDVCAARRSSGRRGRLLSGSVPGVGSMQVPLAWRLVGSLPGYGT